MTTPQVPLSEVRTFLLGLQKRITDAVAALDGQLFVPDS